MSKLNIIQGDDITFNLQFTQENCETKVLEPFDITGYDITVKMPGTTADLVLTSSPAAGVTITDAIKGKVSVTITDLQSAALKKGDGQNFYSILNLSGLEKTVKFKNSLTVEERSFK